jgi:hypothetical protein
VQVAQFQGLTVVRGQRRNGVLEKRFVFPVDQPALHRIGVLFGQLPAIQVIQILGADNSLGPISNEPVIGGATYDGQHPGSRISVGEVPDPVQCS